MAAPVPASEPLAPRRGFTIGFGVGAGFGAFRLADPVDVPVNLYRSTPGVTTRVTNAPWPVTPKGEGPLMLFDLRLGYVITPRFALLFDFAFDGIFWKGPTPPAETDGWSITPNGSGPTQPAVQLHVGGGAQVFLTDAFWARGGLGLGYVSFDPDPDVKRDESDSAGLGVLFGLGYEVQHTVTARQNRALSLELTFLGGPLDKASYALGVAVLAGYQWY